MARKKMIDNGGDPIGEAHRAAQGADDEVMREILITVMLDVSKVEEGQIIRGVYLGSELRDTRFGACMMHVLYDVEEETAVALWGSRALDEGMRRCRRGLLTEIAGRGWLDLAGGKRMRRVSVRQGSRMHSDVPALDLATEGLDAESVLREAAIARGELADDLTIDAETGEVRGAGA